MSSTYGKNLRFTVFGQSHSEAIGVTVEGIPAGKKIDLEELQKFLERRAPGRNEFSTPRKEGDVPEFLSGIKDGVTCGTPLTAIIRNTNTRSKDYEYLRFTPRPGHADYTAEVKFKGAQDVNGGGHFSGRLTAPICILGGMVKQILKEEGIEIFAHISSIGKVGEDDEITASVEDKAFPVVNDEMGKKMQEEILRAKEAKDSVGGVVECVIKGLPAGLGDPMFDGMENRIASIVFGIPAVKGIEFGDGFELARMWGSEANDSFRIEDGKVVTETNHMGGILGGITNGMPLNFKVAFKPTPSIAKKQKTVDLRTMENTEIEIVGRHDPCIVQRAVPVVEAACAIAVYDAILEDRKNR